MVKEALRPTPGLLSPCDAVATVPLNKQLAFSRWQQDIPAEYRGLDAPELIERIGAAKAKLGQRLVILGHHYQREEIIRFADQRGDSFKLAQWAAGNPRRTTSSSAAFTSWRRAPTSSARSHQNVVLPNMTAGCSMADMASLGDVESCWEELAAAGLTDDTLPVTYINSTAALKAFCGRRGGAVCTSSNAPAVFRWALSQKRRVLFFPDEHLGRVTGRALGFRLAQMPVWDRDCPTGNLGGNDVATLRDSRIVLWNGYCSVHQRFTVEQVRRVRELYPGVRVVVHPECRLEVVEAADSYGSTEHIISAVGASPAGQSVGRRHGDQPGQPAGARASRQDGRLARSRPVPVLDDVPHPSGLSLLGAGAARRGRGREPGDGGAGDGALGEGGAGANAGDLLDGGGGAPRHRARPAMLEGGHAMQIDLDHAHVFASDIDATVRWWTEMLDAKRRLRCRGGGRAKRPAVGRTRRCPVLRPEAASRRIGQRAPPGSPDGRPRWAHGVDGVERRTSSATRSRMRAWSSSSWCAAPDDVLVELFQVASPGTMNQYDYVIVGSGIAGLFAALLARDHGSVLILTKDSIDECNTKHAQGGIAAPVGRTTRRSFISQDTVAAGAGLVDEEAARILTERGDEAHRRPGALRRAVR